MPELKTSLCGIELASPIILASSPLTEKAEIICELSKHGVGAVITKSIATSKPESHPSGSRRVYTDSYGMWACSTYSREALNLEDGEDLVKIASTNSSVPIIASVCGLTTDPEEWYSACETLVKAGAKAIQMDLFYLPQPVTDPERFIELIQLCNNLKSALNVPLLPKLNVQIPAYLAAEIFSLDNVSGLSLLDSIRVPPPVFISAGEIVNKFKYVDNLGMASLFGPWQYPLTLHYTSIISKKTNLDLCVGGGVWKPEEVFNLIAYGARCVQIAASGIQGGARKISELKNGLHNMLCESGIGSIENLFSKFLKSYRIDEELGDNIYTPITTQVNLSKCNKCKLCNNWHFCDSINWTSGNPVVDAKKCEGCGMCVNTCPEDAFEYYQPQITG